MALSTSKTASEDGTVPEGAGGHSQYEVENYKRVEEAKQRYWGGDNLLKCWGVGKTGILLDFCAGGSLEERQIEMKAWNGGECGKGVTQKSQRFANDRRWHPPKDGDWLGILRERKGGGIFWTADRERVSLPMESFVFQQEDRGGDPKFFPSSHFQIWTAKRGPDSKSKPMHHDSHLPPGDRALPCEMEFRKAAVMAWIGYISYNCVRLLILAGLQQEEITALTFYHDQVVEIQDRLREPYPLVTITTVDSFQGRENLSVIVSCVWSSEFNTDFSLSTEKWSKAGIEG
uniref:DNA2/NAM7 helicase-like C-terminal domain-containing protein n=1 Tax=Chromera velia CCMP2878 TaxID=1169474 RepID=A0A0G4FJP5_9ALVE|eukprot:Cvel_17340.t1-p1 / transcript=Cvel_17340.t1 / gene=Cvel_17340 / organism=Chromera_velia_CCMP2878 / gene_product=hypothetical protein / transcript_product=hypothetical protein / location=Cvel_scaffold1377:45102-46826(+) / protein_length=287 / sequence_SO=supercontig / SO=protein_coding / is_pseudo=false